MKLAYQLGTVLLATVTLGTVAVTSPVTHTAQAASKARKMTKSDMNKIWYSPKLKMFFRYSTSKKNYVMIGLTDKKQPFSATSRTTMKLSGKTATLTSHQATAYNSKAYPTRYAKRGLKAKLIKTGTNRLSIPLGSEKAMGNVQTSYCPFNFEGSFKHPKKYTFKYISTKKAKSLIDVADKKNKSLARSDYYTLTHTTLPFYH